MSAHSANSILCVWALVLALWLGGQTASAQYYDAKFHEMLKKETADVTSQLTQANSELQQSREQLQTGPKNSSSEAQLHSKIAELETTCMTLRARLLDWRSLLGKMEGSPSHRLHGEINAADSRHPKKTDLSGVWVSTEFRGNSYIIKLKQEGARVTGCAAMSGACSDTWSYYSVNGTYDGQILKMEFAHLARNETFTYFSGVETVLVQDAQQFRFVRDRKKLFLKTAGETPIQIVPRTASR